MKQVCAVLGMTELNTTAYHPQTDGLVENMNRTLRSMKAECMNAFDVEWDQHLQQFLFAYRLKPHESTQKSPYFLLYGRDAKIPTETALSSPILPMKVDLEDYRTQLVNGLTEAWEIAKSNIKKSQQKQKLQYDKETHDVKFKVGDRVMVYMPYEDTGKLRSLP